ncbi:MAG TPA: hypothetical protein VGM13_06050 [Thermoanaerobaculia bacterium]|jgi:hypothetical protein
MNAVLRRTAAALLAAVVLLVLALRAWEAVAPLDVSLSVMGTFWRASTSARLLNSRLFRREPNFGLALLGRDRSLPLGADVVLTVPPALPGAAAEERRRKAAFVLAPRRVTLARGETGREGFALAAAPPGGAP